MKNLKIVAEIGSNWDDKAGILKSICEVSLAGANVFKLQLLRADRLYSKERAPKLYQKMKDYEIPYDWLPDIRRVCHQHNLEFWLSVFDETSALVAADECADALKLASGDLTNKPLRDYVISQCNAMQIPLVLSTGASTQEEIYNAIDDTNKTLRSQLYVIHCVSAYPAKPESYNLQCISELQDTVDVVGISDHTRGNTVAIAAAALGCTIFEKHVIPMSLRRETPDSGLHGTWSENLANYIDDIKSAYAMIHNENADFQPEEANERLWARRGSDGLRPVDEIHEYCEKWFTAAL